MQPGGRLAPLMKARAEEHRRLSAQYAVARTLSEAGSLEEAAPRVLSAFGGRFGWKLGALWLSDGGEGTLRLVGVWRPGDVSVPSFEEACRRASPRRGVGLVGRVWAEGEPAWVEDLGAEDGGCDFETVAAEAGLRASFAFPVRDGRFHGVAQLFGESGHPASGENLTKTAEIVGRQLGQFVERSEAEAQRDRAEEALRESEEKYRTVFDSINEAFALCEVVLDEAGRATDCRLLDVNPAFGRMTGIPPATARGNTARGLIPGMDDRWIETYARVALGGETVRFEGYASPAGRSFDVFASPVGGRGGGRFALVFADVTERERAENAVRESEERFRALIGKGADMITVRDGDGRLTYASPTTQRVTGYTLEEFAALRPFDSVHPEDRARCEDAFRRLRGEPGLSLDLQFRFMHMDGEWRWIEGTFTSLLHEPTIGGIVANVRDITARKQTEDALRRSESHYRTLFGSIDEAFALCEILVNEDGEPVDYRALEVNPAFERMTGIPAARATSMTARELVPDVDRWRIETYGRVAQQGETVRFENHMVQMGRWFEVYASPVGERGDGKFAVVFTDVTERRQTEAEREKLKREAEYERTRLEAVLRQMPGGICIADRGGRITLANEWATRLYGKRLDSVEECRVRARTYPEGEEIPPEDYPLNRALAGESISGMEHLVLGADGAWTVVRVNAAPVRDEEGDVVAAIKVSQDVTAYKETARALRESEERLRTVVQGAPVILFAMNREGTFTLLEGQGLKSLGLTPDDAVGRSVSELFGDAPEALAAARRALEGETFVANVSLRDRVFETWYRPMRDDSGALTSVTGVATDVTERNRAEKERDRSRAAALTARDEVEVTQRRLAFYAGAREERQTISRELHDRVAHSMAVVRQLLELYEVLKDRDPDSAAVKLVLAKEEAKAALNSTRDLSMILRHSEIETGLERALSSLLETTVPDGVRYEVEVDGDATLVPTNVGNQLFLILREAVRNAAAHSDCGHISVGLRILPEGIEASVEDDGRGFGPRVGLDGGPVSPGGGLRSMAERAALVGGRFEAGPRTGGGTRVATFIPLDGEDGGAR